MGINVNFNFDIASQLPLDSRTVVDTFADALVISDARRYQGLLIFVKDTGKIFLFKNGIEDTDLVELGTTVEPFTSQEISDILTAAGY